MFIDEINLNIKAGKGGDGIVSWMHVKGIDHAGPGGGDGGRGGNVYLKGVRDIGKLAEYRYVKEITAENGQNGMGDCMHGKSGKDITIELPIGSIVTNKETGEYIEILDEEDKLFLKGGFGGRGNNHFKGSKNIRPKESTPGKEGEGGEFFIELKLVVDLGLVGLPNAGKSSLLNSVTNAKAKVGNYQFTTLVPNLGDLYGFIIADIPGLIEGASEGKGLGHKFLRHISRTKAVLHCISCENEDVLSVYNIVRKELESYGSDLDKKLEIILLTKTDMVDGEKVASVKKFFAKTHKYILDVSIIDDRSVKLFIDEIVKILRNIDNE